MSRHQKIDYVEFPAKDIEKVKSFFSTIFGWEFTDHGPEYTYFLHEGLSGGFYKSDNHCSTTTGSVLIVFFSDDLEPTQKKIIDAGGTIIKETFSFPGGSRFHFTDPNGNEYAVWSEANSL